jgi:hypothetical protein
MPNKPASITWRAADTTVPVIAPLTTNPPPSFTIDAATVLCDNLRAELLPADNRLRVTTAGAITIPGDLPAGKHIRQWTCDVRGTVFKPKAARALVIVVLGGTTKEIEFPWGKECPADAAPFVIRFKAKEPKTASMIPLSLSVMLVLQRQSTQDQVLIELDGFDVVADVS